MIIENVKKFLSAVPDSENAVLSFDIESLVNDGNFLSDERIISISYAYGFHEITSGLFFSAEDSDDAEKSLMKQFDSLLGRIKPALITGYNHTGYDIPLLVYKTRKYDDVKFWNIKKFLGTSYTIDMMYVIAEDLSGKGEYRIRKLKDAIKEYGMESDLEKKSIVEIEGMDVGKAVRYLWKNDPEKLKEYSEGDSVAVMKIFNSIFRIQ